MAIAHRAPTRDSEAVRRAFDLAALMHRGQLRTDGDPYVAHPVEVSRLLSDIGADEATVAAGLLHDGVEDSELTIDEVDRRFGDQVAAIVAALTEDENIDDWVVRKDALRAQVERAGKRAVSVFAADKLSNLRELRRVYAVRGESAIDLHKAPSLDLRVQAWRDDLAMIAVAIPDIPLAHDIELELERLERERQRRAT
jgi:(p)ppGpp synthase/HD superfamily hydrolase